MDYFFTGFIDELTKVSNAQMGYGLSQPPTNVSPMGGGGGGGMGGGGMSYGHGKGVDKSKKKAELEKKSAPIFPPKKEEMLTGPRMSYKAPAAAKAPAVGNNLKPPSMSAPKRLTAGLGMAKSRTGTLIPQVKAGPKLAPKREEMLAGGPKKRHTLPTVAVRGRKGGGADVSYGGKPVGGAPKPGVDAPLDPYKSKAKARVAKGVKPKSGERTTGWQRHLRKAKSEGTKAFADAKAGKKEYLASHKGSQRYSGGGDAKTRVAQGVKPKSGKAKAAQGTHDRRVAYMKSHGGTLEGFNDKAKASVAKDVKPKGGKSGGKERDYGYASFGSTRKGHAGEGRGPKIYGKELQASRKKLLDDFDTEDRDRHTKKDIKTKSYKRDVANIRAARNAPEGRFAPSSADRARAAVKKPVKNRLTAKEQATAKRLGAAAAARG